MSNVNSSNGYVSLPAQSITTGTETTLLVPPASALYQGLPSPLLAAGAGLYVALDPDYQSPNPYAATPTLLNDSVDGRQFKIRLVGLTTVGAASTFVVKLYNGTSSTVANDTVVASAASFSIGGAGTINWIVEANLIWDSTSTKLNGFFKSSVGNAYTADAATTQVTIASPASLQFIPSFTFGTGNAANTVTVKEFLIEHV